MTDPLPSFERDAPLGRILLLIGAYAPMLAILGLRIGPGPLCWGLVAAGAGGAAVWIVFVVRVVPRRPTYEVNVAAAEPADRDVTAYVATYLLPVLAAKPDVGTGYAAYGIAAALVLIVAYRADLGAVNPLAYVLGFRAYRVTAEGGTRIVLSRSVITKDSRWLLQSAAGLVVSKRSLPMETT